MKKNLLKFLSLLVSIIFLMEAFGIIPAQSVKAADEYDDLREKWKVLLTGGTSYNTSDTDISTRISIITSKAQFRWDNMNKAQGRTYIWSDCNTGAPSDIFETYTRLYTMALAYSTTGSSLQNNITLKNDIISALDWMYTNKYNENISAYGNWFEWEIGAPLYLNSCTVLMYGQLTAGQITNYMNAVDHFKPTVTRNGANRIWECMVIGVRGIIIKDSSKIYAARDGISPVLPYVTGGEGGFYTDGSFIQHWNIAYNGSYGLSLFSDIGNLLYLLSGSTWQVTDTNVENVYQWAYNSFEPIMHKAGIMSMTQGRSMSRPEEQEHKVGHTLIGAFLLYSQSAASSDALAYKKLIKEWISQDTYDSFYNDATIFSIVLAKNVMNDSSITARGDLTKYTQYYNMDRAVIGRPGYTFGISMHSSRIANYESFNDENLRGWHTGDGMTYLYNNDLAQFDDNFWPTVNSYRLPGTTVEQNTSVATGLGGDSWAGGTNILDTYGVTGMALSPNGQTLSAKKSWFMFDNEIVALGSNISSQDNKVVESIVENRKLNSSGNNTLTVNGTAKSSSLGWAETMTGVSWAHLQGNIMGSDIGYYFPGSATVKGLREARTGAWKDINTAYKPDTFTRNYLSLWLDHGTNPTNSSYSYVILPNYTAAQVQSYAANSDTAILANTGYVQAVKENNLNIIGANFWTDTSRTVDIITSNKKASVITKESANDIEISVSDPTKLNTGSIQLDINKAATSIISVEDGITVNQLNPLRITINVNGAKGKTFKAKFSLAGSLSAPTTGSTRVDETDAAIAYSGTWYTYSNSALYNGVEKYCGPDGTDGDYAQLTFNGTFIRWIGAIQPNNGIADVYIDGVKQTSVDQYNATSVVQQVLYEKTGLTSGLHTIRIVSTNQKNASSSDYNTTIDAFEYDMGTTLIDETDAAITYSGTWYTYSDPGLYNGAEKYCGPDGTDGDYAQLTFNGTFIRWIGAIQPNNGIADVYIDGVKQTSVDQYNATSVVQQVLFEKTGLTSGWHTIKIVSTNQKNASSTNYNTTVDAFEYCN